MPYALSTTGQGSTAYVQSSATFGGDSTVAFEFGGRFEVDSLAAVTQLFGSSTTSVRRLQVETNGRLTLFSTSARIQSPIGSIVAGVPFDFKVINNLATGNWELYLNDMVTPVGTFARTTLSFTLNQLPRATIVNTNGFKIYNLWQTVGAFVDRFDDTTAPSTGTVWTSTGGTRTLTCVNFAGAPDSWWVFYSSGATYDLQALGGTFTYSGATAALNRGFRLDATGGTFSYSGAVADLTYNTATVYRIDALGGSFTYTGAQATLLRNFRVDATGGAYSYVGGVASLSRGYMMQSQGGAFSYAGADASLTYVSGPMVYTITALGGAFSYTGAAAEFTATGVIPAASPSAFVNRAYVGGRLTNSAKIGGRLTNNATVAI